MPRLTQNQINDYYRALYEETGECLLWPGAKNDKGYGQKRHNGRTRYVHRLAWEEAHGPIPAGLVLRHLCDQPLCFRLDHLEIGTHHGNAREAIERGRAGISGEDNPNARLTEEQVRAIRQSTLSTTALSLQYGVCDGTIGYIRRGETWKHVP